MDARFGEQHGGALGRFFCSSERVAPQDHRRRGNRARRGIRRVRQRAPVNTSETAATLRAAQVNDLRDIVRDSAANKTTYASLSVRAKSPSQVEALEASIKNLGFNAFSLLDASKSLRTFFSVFDSLLGIFGSLALAVATLGIVNTLVMSILERRREIGVLKALGAADSDVQRLFFVEAGVMGLLGGILGVTFGWLLGRARHLRHQRLSASPKSQFY